MKAIDTVWVTIYGPPKELITDGESGMAFSKQTKEYLARKGIKLTQGARTSIPNTSDDMVLCSETPYTALTDSLQRRGSPTSEDLASLHDKTTSALTLPCDFDTDDALSDQDRDEAMKQEFTTTIQAYPINESKIATAQPGSGPHPGRDSPAPNPKESTCPGCKHVRARSDWTHSRERDRTVQLSLR